MPAAVVLLSGGLDSATVLAIAQERGFTCHTLSFDYGQRHRFELECAAQIASSAGSSTHRVMAFDLRAFGGSALTSEAAVPKNRQLSGEEIPLTYVPARNTIFLSFALAWAEVLGCFDIFIGVNALDYSGYPDCRPEYIAAYERMANLATRAGVESCSYLRIHAPLIDMTKAEIIREGTRLGVDYSCTSSCYDPGPGGQPCGSCDSCVLRAKGFAGAELGDPLLP